jgi:hypothetical protein
MFHMDLKMLFKFSVAGSIYEQRKFSVQSGSQYVWHGSDALQLASEDILWILL